MSDTATVPREFKYGLNPNFNPEWTVERVELLKRLWQVDELSASQCAKELGGITRNAVIGKVARLGLPSRTLANPFRKARAKEKVTFKVERRKIKAERPQRFVVQVEVDLPEPPSLNIPFKSRRMNLECSWISGDPSAAVCCGHRVKMLSQFCPHHHKRVWQKPEKRAR